MAIWQNVYIKITQPPCYSDATEAKDNNNKKKHIFFYEQKEFRILTPNSQIYSSKIVIIKSVSVENKNKNLKL
jgi:hypothetical protein